MNTDNLEQRARAAAEEIRNVHILGVRRGGPINQIILRHFADVGGNERLREAATALVKSKWQHRCSDGVGGCVAVSQSCLFDFEEALALAQSSDDGRKELPRILFDGYAVLEAMPPDMRKRTSAENVGDVLDTVVKILRRKARAALKHAGERG